MQKLVNRKGFTLVELVVVIAVLAILAGVGVVAYNGYIEKAREAADIELLGAVNTAFASACAENGVEGLPEKTFTLGGETVNIGTNGAVHLVDKLLPEAGLTDSPSLNSAFDKYYEGNESKEFQVFETLVYDPKTGGFSGQYGNVIILDNNWKMVTTDNGDGSHTYTVTGKDGKKISYTMKDADLASYQNSTFGNMPVSKLMGNVDSITDAMIGALGSIFNPNYDALGIDKNDYKRSDGTIDEEAMKKAAANAYVLLVAKSTTSGSFDCDKYMESVVDNKQYQVGIDDLYNKFALDIAMTTSFANSEYGNQSITVGGQTKTVAQHYAEQLEKLKQLTAEGADMAKINKELSLFAIEKDPLFKTYYAAHGEQDLNAYLSTLSAITQNDQAVRDSGVLENGWDDEDFGAILDAVFGGGTTAP